MRTVYNTKNWTTLLFCLFITLTLFAQSPEDVARTYLQNHAHEWNLTSQDVAELSLKDEYQSNHNGLWHIYLQQEYQGIEIQNAILNLNILDNQVIHFGNRLVGNIVEKINTTNPTIDGKTALLAAANFMNISINEPIIEIERTNTNHKIEFEKGSFANKNPVMQLQFLLKEEKLHLIWATTVEQKDVSNYKTVMIDATDGRVLEEFNHILNCKFGHGSFLSHKNCNHEHSNNSTPEYLNTSTVLTDNANYQVWEYPIQSPVDGSRTLTGSGIADDVASPFGWHDTNGEDGVEYNYTRGNNVHAYVTQGTEPEGSANCFFTATFNPAWEPAQYEDASTIQLFYSCNMMHDMAYRYGFDQAAGNYQENNYAGGGLDGDYVIAQAQVSTQTNNAEFTIEPDGQNSTMRMYRWNRMGLLTVNEPVSVAGIYETRGAEFGATITNTPISGNVVIANDGSGTPTLACQPLINGAEINGNVALVDRGICDYSEKALHAQNAGAIAIIVCNADGGTFNEMGVGCCGNDVNIPAVLVPYNDCQVLRSFAGSSLNVSFIQPQTTGPENLDGALDNTITSHEYAHGISVRLTGGGNSAICLNNDEQMGEGWSDFFALAMTAKSGDDGTEARGMSTYVLGQDTDGIGIRRQPYSTDFQVNSQTYHDIVASTRPHPLGEIWASALWDLYWEMVEIYGFDEDVVNGTGGNNMAIQLVMDGMKLQPCGPGFIDGRDAILMADEVNNNGNHQCLIWEVFARRGLGFGADQGSAGNRNDGKESYDTRPDCIKELKISKTMTPIIEAGEDIDVVLTIINHKDATEEGVVVTDVFPEGTEFKNMLTNTDFSINGNMIVFEIGDLPIDEEMTIAYRLTSAPDLLSVLQFFDGAEAGENNWNFEILRGNNIWIINDEEVLEGNNAWFAPAIPEECDFTMELKTAHSITGDQPILRFFHWYDTEWGNDGGIVEVSTDGGDSWEQVEDKFFRNGYETVLSFFTFNVPKIPAFAGDGDFYRASYVDLSAYIGQNVNIRFRFGNDEEISGNENGTGWYVDNIEFMEMFNYNSEACITSIDGAIICAEAGGRGTIVNSDKEVATYEPLENVAIAVFPNPTKSILNVNIQTEAVENLTISLLSVDGKTVLEQSQSVFGEGHFELNISNLVRGFYFVQVVSGNGILMRKVVVD